MTNTKQLRNKKSLIYHTNFSRKQAAIIVLLFVVVGCIVIWRSLASESQDFVRGEVLVSFKSTTSQSEQNQLLASNRATVKQEIPQIKTKVIGVPENAEDAVVKALSHNPAVAFAEKNWIAKPQEQMPNDPFFPSGNYAIGGGAWGWQTSHTTEAWDVTQGDPSIIIAILDTGLKPQGLDFDGQLVPGWNVMNNTADYTTNAGVHGTYVAGAAGLAINNAKGNAGYCPKCKIMPIQVGTDSGASYANMAAGLSWAIDHGARIANLSFAGTTASSTLATAVNYARSKNLVIFASAGNSNCDCPTYPSATPGVFGVGGVDNTGAKAGPSNFGTWVDLVAPMGNMTAWPVMGSGGPGYLPVGGTSLAAPAAAGMAGLVLSAKPSMSGLELEQALQSTTTPASFTVQYGLVNPLAALQSLGFTSTQPSTAPVNTSPVQIHFYESNDSVSHIKPLTSAPQAGQRLVRGQGSWTGAYPLSIAALKWERCNPSGTSCVTVSSASTYTVQAADAGFSLKLTVSVKNLLGTTVASPVLSLPVAAATADSTKPTVSITSPANNTSASGAVNITASAYDNIGVTKVEFYADGVLYATDTTSPHTATWNATGLAAGSPHSLTAIAYDAAGNVGNSAAVNVTIANPAPSDTEAPTVTISTPANNALLTKSTTISASASDNVLVTKMSLYINGNLKATSTTGSLTYRWNTAGVKAGTNTILVQATDAIGNLGQSSITVRK